jgi:hypothetical protein
MRLLSCPLPVARCPLPVGLRSVERVPSPAVQVARASSRDGTTAMRVKDRLTGLWRDVDSSTGNRAMDAPVSRLLSWPRSASCKFLLGQSDRQAAEAVHYRVDFRHALALGRDVSGFHHGALAVDHATNHRDLCGCGRGVREVRSPRMVGRGLRGFRQPLGVPARSVGTEHPDGGVSPRTPLGCCPSSSRSRK